MNSERFKKPSFTPTYHKLLILCLIIVLFLVCCIKNKDQIAPETLALVNGIPITKKELVNRLELTALPEFHKAGDRNKRALNLLIDELVVSQWAQKQDIINSSDYKELMDFVKQQALIRELFFEEIRAHAEPDSHKIHQALGKSMQQITVQTLFTDDENIAVEWQNSLYSGKTFEYLLEELKDYNTSYLLGHFVLKLKEYKGGLYASRSQRAVTCMV